MPDRANELLIRKAPVPDRQRFLAGLATDLHAGTSQGTLTAVILIQIENLRLINRRFGYEVGDSVLALVADKLAQNIKKASLIRRVGDERFAVIVPELSSARLLPVAARKIQSFLGEAIHCGEHDIHLQCWVGISIGPAHGNSDQSLLIHAEESLERAARNTEGCYVADASSDANRVNEWKLREDLSHAVSSGELSLNFQPKICLETFNPVACEALMRWNSANHGDVGPDTFIPIAENSGLDVDLTEWAILSLPRQAKNLVYRDKPLNVAVNLSPRDLITGNLNATFQTALKIWEMNSENITLEITESILLDKPEACLEVMNELRELGFRLSIDDFGTGYSSMSYFKLIPADEIKIDKCFISNLVHSRDDQIIVKAIIAVAHQFKMKTVAEGVEDAETLQMLMKMRCDYVQGYYFSKPLPGPEFQQWLQSYAMQRYFVAPRKTVAKKAANS